jgi:hypothetical protein
MKNYIWRILILIDQGCNVLFAPLLNLYIHNSYKFGNPDETLSSVMGKQLRAGNCKGCKFICRILNKIDPRHCNNSIEEDEQYVG